MRTLRAEDPFDGFKLQIGSFTVPARNLIFNKRGYEWLEILSLISPAFDRNSLSRCNYDIAARSRHQVTDDRRLNVNGTTHVQMIRRRYPGLTRRLAAGERAARRRPLHWLVRFLSTHDTESDSI